MLRLVVVSGSLVRMFDLTDVVETGRMAAGFDVSVGSDAALLAAAVELEASA